MLGFGKKKNGDFFVELDETKAEKTAPATAAKVVAETPAPKEKKISAQPVAAKPAAVAPVKPKKVEVPTVVNFATQYLIVPSDGSRRRPGPSLNAFKNMASTMYK